MRKREYYRRKVINTNTLQIFDSLTECAKFYKEKVITIYWRINKQVKGHQFKNKGKEIEYLDYWIYSWNSKEKKDHCHWADVDFL